MKAIIPAIFATLSIGFVPGQAAEISGAIGPVLKYHPLSYGVSLQLDDQWIFHVIPDDPSSDLVCNIIEICSGDVSWIGYPEDTPIVLIAQHDGLWTMTCYNKSETPTSITMYGRAPNIYDSYLPQTHGVSK